MGSKSAMLADPTRNEVKSKTLDDGLVTFSWRKKSAPLPKKSVQVSVR